MKVFSETTVGELVGVGLAIASSLLIGALVARITLPERMAATVTAIGGGVVLAAIASNRPPKRLRRRVVRSQPETMSLPVVLPDNEMAGVRENHFPRTPYASLARPRSRKSVDQRSVDMLSRTVRAFGARSTEKLAALGPTRKTRSSSPWDSSTVSIVASSPRSAFRRVTMSLCMNPLSAGSGENRVSKGVTPQRASHWFGEYRPSARSPNLDPAGNQGTANSNA